MQKQNISKLAALFVGLTLSYMLSNTQYVEMLKLPNGDGSSIKDPKMVLDYLVEVSQRCPSLIDSIKSAANPGKMPSSRVIEVEEEDPSSVQELQSQGNQKDGCPSIVDIQELVSISIMEWPELSQQIDTDIEPNSSPSKGCNGNNGNNGNNNNNGGNRRRRRRS